MGFALAPARNGKVIPPDEFETWPEAKRRAVQESIEIFEKNREHIFQRIPQSQKGRHDEMRKLNRDTSMFTVAQSIEDLKAKLSDIPRIIVHLNAPLVPQIMVGSKGEQSGTLIDAFVGTLLREASGGAADLGTSEYYHVISMS
jgi:hypothetical protein